MNQKSVLCFGDSNTWGSNVETCVPAIKRYDSDIRWTRRLQTLLGNSWYLVEEGLSGRTTVLNDPLVPGRSGKDFLSVCIRSHQPLDVVILMLGTNDAKAMYKSTPKSIVAGMRQLVEIIQLEKFDFQENRPTIIIASPAPPTEEVLSSPHGEFFDQKSIDNLRCLAPEYEKLAKEKGCLFIDAAEITPVSRLDGLHLDANGHLLLGKAFFGFFQKHFFSVQ